MNNKLNCLLLLLISSKVIIGSETSDIRTFALPKKPAACSFFTDKQEEHMERLVTSGRKKMEKRQQLLEERRLVFSSNLSRSAKRFSIRSTKQGSLLETCLYSKESDTAFKDILATVGANPVVINGARFFDKGGGQPTRLFGDTVAKYPELNATLLINMHMPSQLHISCKSFN